MILIIGLNRKRKLLQKKFMFKIVDNDFEFKSNNFFEVKI